MSDLELVLRDLLVPAGVARNEMLAACAAMRAVSIDDDVIKRFDAACKAYADASMHVVSVLFGFAPELFVDQGQITPGQICGVDQGQMAPGQPGGEAGVG